MTLILSIPIWAGEQTVVINRNEGQFEESNGVYYCYKGGLMMTFTSGMNNPNYLVEHQQVYFEVRSVNQSYIIKKIVFRCVDNTTSDNLDCFYWGPSTISIVQNFYNQSEPGTYTYSGYTGTWVGETNKIQFTTMAKPVRFGSVEITFEKETGDIYDLVTDYSQLQPDQKYVIVNQRYNMAMSTAVVGSFSNTQTTMDAVGISFVDDTKRKVIINPEVQIFTLEESTASSNRPWLFRITGSSNYLRRHSEEKVGSSYNSGYGLYYEGLNATYSPFNINLNSYDDPYARIRFKLNSMQANDQNDNHAISYVNSYTYFRTILYGSDNAYEPSQRVYLYMPAQNYEITTECDPAAGGYITLGDGVLELNGHQTSQQFETVTFFVGTNEGYGVGSVTATDSNGNPVELTLTSSSALGNNYSFTMPGADVHIVATFTDPYEIHTVSTPQYGGEFDFLSGAVDLNNTYISNEGKTVTFTVSPSQGYVFTGLTGTNDTNGSDLNLIDNGDGTYTFTMPANDVTLRATFDRVIGDIFDLVTSTSQIVDGATYIIVSQYHDKVMKHWNRSETTFQGTPIVEWVEADKSRVRVDDNACFFRLDADNTSGNPAGFLNTQVGYLGYSGYNGTTGNVVSTPDLSAYNHATMYISGLSTGEHNYLCTFDSIGNANHTIRYEAATNSFRIINYGNNTDERVWLYKLADNYHNISTVCKPAEGGSITVDATSAQEGETVTFTTTTNQGYTFDHVTVTYTDGTEGEIPVTEENGTYTFTMPDGAVTITAYFAPEDLYLLGTALGKTWAPYGPKFTYDYNNEYYYIDVYFKGIRQGLNWTNGDDRYGYFSLTTKIADPSDQNGWATIGNYRIYPDNNGYDMDIVDGQTRPIAQNYSGKAFVIPAGIYRIIVNTGKTEVTVRQTPVSLTITSPEDGATVSAGTDVTWTSDVNEKVQAIADLYADVNEPAATNDYSINNGGKVIGDHATLTQGGNNTVTADAWIGYIEASDAATYNVVAPQSLYLLGFHNGSSTFQMYGTPLEYDINTNTYSIKVYYKGIRQGREYTDGDLQKGYFHFSTVQDNSSGNPWNYLIADWNDYPVTSYVDDGTETPAMHHLNAGSDHSAAFEIEPGIYTIYVSGDKTQMWVEKHPVELTLTPAGGTLVFPLYVTYGTVVTATSNLEDEVQSINSNEEAVFYFNKGYNSILEEVEGDTIKIIKTGRTWANGHAYIGWIEPTANGYYAYTPLHYLEDNPAEKIDKNQVVCDTLVGVWAARTLLWCKDIGNKSIDAKYPKMIPGTESMQRDYNVEFDLQDGDWDQSNWVAVDLVDYLWLNYGLDPSVDEDLSAIDEIMSQFVNKQLEPLSVKGYYSFENGMFKIYMSERVPQILGDTIGYPGFLRDPHEELNGVVYCYNYYTPSNFLFYSYPHGQTPGPQASADDRNDPENNFFFVNPKIGEVAHVWGVWKGNDEFVVYKKSSKTNRYDLNGKFRVASWNYNRLDKDSNTDVVYGNPNETGDGSDALQVNFDYDFHIAIISLEETEPVNMHAPKREPSATAMGEYKDYEFQSGDEKFMVFPLDLLGHGSTYTDVNEVESARVVESVSFFNVMGQESKTPFEGVNIVVTRYNDGTTQVNKVLM